jgi:hypothetical protein
VLDGEVVIAGARGLDFEALLLRIHPAASRVKLLAAGMPAPSSPGTCWRSATATCARSRWRRAARSWSGRSAPRPRRCTCRRRPWTALSPRTGSAASRAPGSTG